jgi:HlyD family secretion protein
MRSSGRNEYGVPRWGNPSRDQDWGPQGEALILELQRLRRALDAEVPGNRRRRSAEPQPRARRRPPRKRSPTSRMSQAIDICLQHIGLKAPAEKDRPAHAQREPDIVPPNRASPTLAPHDPLTMDLSAPAPEMAAPAGLQMNFAAPGLAPTHQGEVATRLGPLIEVCRRHVTTGVAFVLGSDEAGPPPDIGLAFRTRWSLDKELRTGLRVLVIACVLGGGWFFFMPLAGAVVVPGNLVVESNVKTIQHPTGGVVADIKVVNGARVKAGDLLVRLDATQARASLQVVSKQLDELRARIARLAAERDGRMGIEFPGELAARASDETVRTLLASEDTLFKARASARQSQRELQQGRIAQLTEEISGFETQVAARTRQLELIQGELGGVQDLYDKHLVPLTRLTALQREAARIDGERGQLTSSIAETKSKIGEAALQIVRLDQDFRSEVVKDLGEAQGKEAELVERSVAARDLLDRIEIRSPTSGLVHQLTAHTIGGVIRPGDTIMEIVPDTENLQIEARLQPQDIDQVHPGQPAFVRFSAFNQRTTPQLTGSVSYVSADTSHDQQTNASYFTVRVVLPDEERRRLAGQQLVPGMPAEVFMQTGSRTMMSYLFKPIVDQMRRAFVEQ